jgi:hypothetical protein
MTKIEAEIAKAKAKLAKQWAAANKTQGEIDRLEEALKREKLRALVGKPVKRDFRDGGPFDSAIGTLVWVKRKWCMVEYPEPIKGSTKWEFPIANVVPADARQGVSLGHMMASGDMGD